jgi:hypothetical protein
MKHVTLRRIGEVAEYERARHNEPYRGKYMSTLVLEWILEKLNEYETRMLVEMEAADLARDAGFAGKPPSATAPWEGLQAPAESVTASAASAARPARQKQRQRVAASAK